MVRILTPIIACGCIGTPGCTTTCLIIAGLIGAPSIPGAVQDVSNRHNTFTCALLNQAYVLPLVGHRHTALVGSSMIAVAQYLLSKNMLVIFCPFNINL